MIMIQKHIIPLLCLYLHFSLISVKGFQPATSLNRNLHIDNQKRGNNYRIRERTFLLAKESDNSSKGFGKKVSGGKGFAKKTYGSATRSSSSDVIDTTAAMSSFFSTNQEWDPLFRSLISSPSVPAMEYLTKTGIGEGISFDDDTPWKQLDGVPTEKKDLNVIASFLDSVQQALVEIPVDESTKDGASDLHFIEEGRRMLIVSRFHVLSAEGKNRIELYDELFTTCWSELAELKRANQADTGSLILLPGYDIQDLRKFTEMNLHLPLDWLGVSGSNLFEVAAFERDSPGIRILHRLSDIPKASQRKPETLS